MHPGWGLGVNNIHKAYVLIFGERLLVRGRDFGSRPNVARVVDVVSRLLRESGDD